MRIRHLLFGILLIAVSLHAAADPPPKACNPIPFACFVKEWEDKNTKNGLSTIKEMIAFYEENCKNEKCTTKCPDTLDEVVSFVDKKGIQFACNISDNLCQRDKPNGPGCIPMRTFKYFDLTDSSTTTDAPSTAATTNQSPPKKRRHLPADDKDGEAPAPAPETTSAPNDQEPSVKGKFVTIETIMLPVCRHGGMEEDSPHFCQSLSTCDQTLKLKQLPWNSFGKICAVVEQGPGEGYDEKLLDSIVAKKTKAPLVPEVPLWQYTGLPFEVIGPIFLAGRDKTEKKGKLCDKYSNSTESCGLLPICDKTTERMKVFQLKDNKKVPVEVDCEQPCTGKSDPRKGGNCRVLDTKELRMYRQGLGPFAEFLSKEDSLLKSLLDEEPEPTTANPDSTTAPATTPAATPAASRKKRADDPTKPVRIPLPIDLGSVKDKSNEDKIRNNYWLSSESNPYFRSYSQAFSLLELSECDGDDDKKICNKKDGLSTGLIIGIAAGVGVLVLVCIIVIVAVIIIKKKKGNEQGGETADPSVAAEGGKSAVQEVSQAGGEPAPPAV